MDVIPSIESIFQAVTPTRNLRIAPGTPLFTKLEVCQLDTVVRVLSQFQGEDILRSPLSSATASLDHFVSGDLSSSRSFELDGNFLSPNSAGLFRNSPRTAGTTDLNLDFGTHDLSQLYTNGEFEQGASRTQAAASSPTGVTPSAFLREEPFEGPLSMSGGFRSQRGLLSPPFRSPFASGQPLSLSNYFRSPPGASPFSMYSPLGGLYNVDLFRQELRKRTAPPPVSQDEGEIIDENGKKRPPPLAIDANLRRSVKQKTES